MINQEQYSQLKKEFGQYSSWALWEDGNHSNLSIFDNSVSDLRSDIIMVALNISRPTPKAWSNFHCGRNDFKLQTAFNHSSFRGAYMTDIIKGEVDPDSGNIQRQVQDGSLPRQSDLDHFNREIELLQNVPEKTVVIVFGWLTELLFLRNFGYHFPNIIRLTHYSTVMKKDLWLSQTWELLENKTKDLPIEMKFKKLE